LFTKFKCACEVNQITPKVGLQSAGGGRGVAYVVFGNYHRLQTLAEQGACCLNAAHRFKTLMVNIIAVDKDNSGV